MTITPSSRGDGTWSVAVEGRVRAPAPEANLTLGPWQGKGRQDAPVDQRRFNLSPNETFSAELGGPVLPPGQHAFHVQFEYQMGEHYRLNQEYRIQVDRSAFSYTFEVEPVLYTGDEGDPFRARSDSRNETSDGFASEPRLATLATASPAGALPVAGDGPETAAQRSVAANETEPLLATTLQASTTTLTGTLWFLDPTDVWRECWHCHVRVWDSDTGSDESLGWFQVGWDGSFSFTVNNDDDEGGGIEPYFVIFSRSGDNGKAEVRETDGTLHRIETDVLNFDCPDGTCVLGRVDMATNGDAGYGYLAFHGLAKAWYDLRWDPEGPQVNIGQVDAVAPDTSTTVSHLHHTTQEIHLAPQETSLDIIVHEHGHYTMYTAYNSDPNDPTWWFDDEPRCDGAHYFNEADGGTYPRRCAWVEGWADFFPVWVWPGDDRLHLSSGTWYDVETWVCYDASSGMVYDDCADRPARDTGDTTGDDVEGRVAATLMDLWDPGPDNGDEDSDGADFTFANIWTALVHDGGDDYNFRWYCRNWGAHFSEAAFRDVARLNTIDYGSGC